ncbi:RnaseH-domain-containing protein [Trametes cingulata]|nr:RnaseH-domain-containing protein [Trametes cingulata]
MREDGTHKPHASCPCYECDADRRVRCCDNPHRCATAAHRAISKLHVKWNPLRQSNLDGLTLTKSRKRKNAAARVDNGRILFDPSVTQDVPVSSVFRVFTSPDREPTRAALRPKRPFQVAEEAVEVFTDGSCHNNGWADAAAGSGIWFGPGDARNEGARVPANAQSNQAAEVYAASLAGMKVPPFAPLHIVSDSKYLVDGLTLHLPKWERRGWIRVANPELFQDVVARLRARSAPTTLRWVKGHSRDLGNEAADELAKVGAALPQQYRPCALPPQQRYLVNGASLAHLTQKLAYQGIRESVKTPTRRASREGVREVCSALKMVAGLSYTEHAVWSLLRKDPVQRKVRDFLWKAIHDAYRVGKYWENIPGYEDRELCAYCGETESMNHILAECRAPGQETIWRLARALLRIRRISLPEVTGGLAKGSHLFAARRVGGEADNAGTRLARIVLTESAHCIWRMRCERVIGWIDEPERVHSTVEIENVWLASINKRLSMDIATSNKRTCGNRAVKPQTVLATWRGLLDREQDLPDDWLSCPGVLVGKPLERARGVG